MREILIIVHNRLSKFISQKQKGQYIEGIIIIFLLIELIITYIFD